MTKEDVRKLKCQDYTRFEIHNARGVFLKSDDVITIMHEFARRNDQIAVLKQELLQTSTDKSKLLLADVSNRRKLLIAFADAINVCDGDKRKIGKLVDIYLKIN